MGRRQENIRGKSELLGEKYIFVDFVLIVSPRLQRPVTFHLTIINKVTIFKYERDQTLGKEFIIKRITLPSVRSTKNMAFQDMLKGRNINSDKRKKTTCAMWRSEEKYQRSNKCASGTLLNPLVFLVRTIRERKRHRTDTKMMIIIIII